MVHVLRLPVLHAASSSTASSSSSVALAAHSMTADCARGDLDKQAKGPAVVTIESPAYSDAGPNE